MTAGGAGGDRIKQLMQEEKIALAAKLALLEHVLRDDCVFRPGAVERVTAMIAAGESDPCTLGAAIDREEVFCHGKEMALA